ncbi:MAG TPA: hypothetical protein VER36_04570 [Flavisolibacter sp.]|nr:hypothetical protein [Flavisolibacter sp.]
MESFLMFLATSLVLRITTPKFKRYLLANGCSVLLVSGNRTLHFKHTRDGERVYFYDHAVAGVTYGLIMVHMKELYTLHQAENILVQYINRMRRPLRIAYNVAMQIEKKKGVITICDYWQDEAGHDWKIKGYTNGKTIAVLYVKNIGESPVNEHDGFINGFRFPNFS